ncbi:hypothetical protein SO802_005603 [Lithocarpus litseifolius]|uniref:Heat shock protein 70 n=1 Tax=Lithocarpus litseifolius TaxID=425828 RepID=A0AAW2DMV1_9ROSI
MAFADAGLTFENFHMAEVIVSGSRAPAMIKLSDKYQKFVADAVREEFTTKLQEVENWLYEDGEDETKGVYIAKLEELKKQGDPIEERYKESCNRGAVIDQLLCCINSYRKAADSNDPRFDHINVSEKEKVLNERVEAEAWLREKKLQQDSLPKYVNPVFSSADVLKKTETLDRFLECREAMDLSLESGCRELNLLPSELRPPSLEDEVTFSDGPWTLVTNIRNLSLIWRGKGFTAKLLELVRCINSYREAAVSNDPRFDHIDISEKEKVLNECVEAEAWLTEKRLQQDSLPKYVNPVLSSADVLKKTETLDSEQQQPQGVDANASTAEGAADGSAETPASAEPMDTETSTTSARSPSKWFLSLKILFSKKEFGSYLYVLF